MTAVEAALAAARRGWHVFPCGGRSNPKEPRDSWKWTRWNTTDPAKIRLWLADTDVYGIACDPSSLVGVDLDMPKPGYTFPDGWAAEPGVRDGKDILAVLCELAGEPWPCTYSVITPSGGWHLYFQADPARRITVSVGDDNNGVAPLIDIRGTGGYLVGPGSVIGGRAYEVFDDRDPVPLPGWLAGLCEKNQAAPVPRPRAVPHYGRHDNYARAALDSECATIAAAPEGSRNHQLNTSAYKLARFAADGTLDPDELWNRLCHAAGCAGLSALESDRTIRSAFKARGVR